MMKQDPVPPPPPTTTTAICGQCGIEERKLLHNIRLRGNFRRLCTSCVLRLHPQFFCPACLGVYDRSPPDDAVVCYKCYSSSHPSCVPAATINSSRNPSPCSSCLNPNLLVLNLGRAESGGGRLVDANSARLLLAAAKIAAMSMSKAEVAAASEAERRSKEAAYTKKRAKEALDHVVKLMQKQTLNVVENRNHNHNYNKVINSVVSNANNRKVDDSSEVVRALNAVELKDNGTPVEKIVDGAMVMEVDAGAKDSGFGENGAVKNDGSVTIVQNGEDQGNVENNGSGNPAS